MPVVSNAQRRFMYATAQGKTSAPASVGQEFIDKSHGITGLPERVGDYQSYGAQGHKHPGLAQLLHGVDRGPSKNVDDIIQGHLQRKV